MRAVFRPHDEASRTKYQNTVQLARSQRRVLAGTPGTLKKRTQAGNQYWVREHIRTDGAKVDEYIGTVATVNEARIKQLRAEIDLAQSLASASAALRLLGFQRTDRKPAAVLAVFFNRGLYQAGLTLVGSHAYGALLNELGVSASAYRTKDLDVARAQPLSIAIPHDASFGALLSFKLPGAEQLLVDLLVPGKEIGKVVEVKELGAHAQTIPFLEFLIEEPLDAVVLSPNQVIAVKVPSPERFVLHKLFSSQSRRIDPSKTSKDREQAAIIAAALEEQMPGRLLDAWKTFPRAGKPALRRGAGATVKLVAGAHQEAEAVMRKLAAQVR